MILLFANRSCMHNAASKHPHNSQRKKHSKLPAANQNPSAHISPNQKNKSPSSRIIDFLSARRMKRKIVLYCSNRKANIPTRPVIDRIDNHELPVSTCPDCSLKRLASASISTVPNPVPKTGWDLNSSILCCQITSREERESVSEF